MKRLITTLLIMISCAGISSAQNTYGRDIFISSKGDSLRYRHLEPETYKEGDKYPLVIYLHDVGKKGNDNEKQLAVGANMFLNPVNREKYPAYVLFPQCPKEKWWTYDRKPKDFDRLPFADTLTTELASVKELIDAYLGNPKVDRSRIYVMGFSMGAVGTYDIVLHYPEIFAAAIPISGGIAAGHMKEARDVSFRIFHGDSDPSVPVECSRRAYRELSAAGAKVEYIEIPGGKHGIANTAFGRDDFMEWLFKQKKH